MLARIPGFRDIGRILRYQFLGSISSCAARV